MIRDRVILCIASRWDYDPTSKHHVMRILARHNDVVWVNYHGTRRPRATLADLTAVTRTVRRAARGIERVGPNMVQLTPLLVPGACDPRLRRLNQWMLTLQIRRAIRAVRRAPTQPLQLWTYAPDVDGLIGRFGEECVVYCCVDEFREFAGVDRATIEQAERRLLQRCDVVFATSQPLYESRRAIHPNTHLLRHGVDAQHFRRALDDDLPLPGDLTGVRRPIVGFFGLIHDWIDCELIAAVARLRPAVSFVLIGESRVRTARWVGLPNVHLLGRRDYSTLPAYCKAFDVAMLPFARNALTESANPIKLREYLAAGLPVVSTPVPEAERYRPDVLIADDAQAFAAACDAAVRQSGIEQRRRRSQRVAGETWEAVVERASEIVLHSLVSRLVPPRCSTLTLAP